MHGRQLQSLLIEPLQALIEEPRGLGSIGRLSSQYSSLSHDFYDSLAEFLALEGDSTSAASAKAHAKTTAKATAKAGAAVVSSVSSRLGAGIGLFGRKLNQQFGGKFDELTGAMYASASGEPPPPPPPPPVPLGAGEAERSSSPASMEGADANRDALAELRSVRPAPCAAPCLEHSPTHPVRLAVPTHALPQPLPTPRHAHAGARYRRHLAGLQDAQRHTDGRAASSGELAQDTLLP